MVGKGVFVGVGIGVMGFLFEIKIDITVPSEI